MLLLGFISILQIMILPGIVALYFFKINACSRIQMWLLVFTLSLFINYVLVTILTLLTVYTSFVFWGIVFFELCFLYYLYLSKGITGIINFSFTDQYKKLTYFLEHNSPLNRILFFFAGMVILFYVAVFLANIGTIFYFIDSVNNHAWNSWACEFANNILPQKALHYPQLIPANWSICYLLIGKTNIHFFPKFIMPLFFINNLLIFLDLALTKRNNIYLIALIIYGLISPIILSLIFLGDGNADIPVAFFVLMTFYLLIKISPKTSNNFISLKKIEPENKVQTIKYYLMVFLFASMAVATKLAGAYVFVLTSFLLSIFLFQVRKKLCKADVLRIFSFVFLISFFSLFWYFKNSGALSSGFDQRRYLLGDYLFNALRAFKMIFYNWGLPVCVFLLLTITTSLFDKKIRFITITIVLIPLILWAIKYSVDFRNLSFVLPILSFSAAAGFLKLFNLVNTKGSENGGGENTINSIDLLLFSKKIRILLLSLMGSVLLLNLTLSDVFYIILYNVYTFIHKYYFLSNRIVYFIEYDLQLHVDFYQRTYIAFALIVFLLIILVVSKIRVYTLIGLTLILLTLLNFTSLSEKNIINYQRTSFEKVEARNYYSWINMILKNEDVSDSVYTNFKYILKDSIPRDIKFKFIRNISKSSLFSLKDSYVFLKSDILDQETKTYLKQKFTDGKYKLILDDNNYLFFMINQG